MIGASVRTDARRVFTRVLDRDQVLISTSPRGIRRSAAVVVVAGFVLLVVLVAHNPDVAAWQGRLAWSLTLLVAVLLLARGIYLGRPVTAVHAVSALAMLVAGFGTHLLGFAVAGDVLVAGSGLAMVWPLRSQPEAGGPESVWPLIAATRGDALAPFAMQSRKSLFFNEDRSAALAYRTQLGFAVVSGDPVGTPAAYRSLVRDFAAMCQHRGWRIIVLNCGARRLNLWRDKSRIGQSLLAVPVGRDVVVDAAHFTLTGRRFRNLRQAVARTHNRGVTTEIVSERELDPGLRSELADVVHAAHGAGRFERGFSMMLDGALEGRYPGVVLIVGRDRAGQVQAFHRYVVSGPGSDVSLDLPWRRPGAPNGIDERLSVDMIEWCRACGVRRVSLAFAAFPELFAASDHTVLQRICHVLIRLGSPLIQLESLYRYVRKFHALDRRRYVLVSGRHLPLALVVLLWLEFVPHRSRR